MITKVRAPFSASSAMAAARPNPPYFDGLLRRLAADDQVAAAAFGRHVHWGYWKEPLHGGVDNYGAAAETLCRELCDLAGADDGMSIVDVGCGFGGTLASLNERFTDLRLIGVNIDLRQLQFASQEAKPRQGNRIEFVGADAAGIPLRGKRFDIVLAVECVFHFDRTAFFAEAARLLRPGGNLTLSDFVPSERALEYFREVDFSADEAVRASYGQIDLSYSVERYRQLGASNQLRLESVIDITEQTLPTYEFIYESSKRWSDEAHGKMFCRATRRLEKACRKGLLKYQMLRFDLQ